MKYLGIDYGKSKFGTAFSEGELASPGKVVKVSGLYDALAKIKKIITEESVEVVVVGLPESGEARSVAEKFIRSLEHDMLSQDIKIFLAEETLSTKRGLDSMITLGVSKKKRAQEDAFAAAEILQEYLDSI